MVTLGNCSAYMGLTNLQKDALGMDFAKRWRSSTAKCLTHTPSSRTNEQTDKPKERALMIASYLKLCISTFTVRR